MRSKRDDDFREGRRGLVDGSGRVLLWLGFARSSPPPRTFFVTIPDESCFAKRLLTNLCLKVIQIDLFCLRSPEEGAKSRQKYSQKKLFQKISVKISVKPLTKQEVNDNLVLQFGKEENEVK